MEMPVRSFAVHVEERVLEDLQERLRGTRWPDPAPGSPWSQGTDPPPGESSTSSVVPAQTNDMARVTTMSGTRVTTISDPLIAPTAIPRLVVDYFPPLTTYSATA